METKAEDRAVLARAVTSGDLNESRGASGLASLLAVWLALCDDCDAADPDIRYEPRFDLDDLEWRIIQTPAANMAELLLKGRVAKRWFDTRKPSAFFAGARLADDAARLADS